MKIESVIFVVILTITTAAVFAQTPTPPPSTSTIVGVPAGTSLLKGLDAPDVKLGNIVLEDVLIWWDKEYWDSHPGLPVDHEALIRFSTSWGGGSTRFLDFGPVTRDNETYFLYGTSDFEWGSSINTSGDYALINDYATHSSWPLWKSFVFFGAGEDDWAYIDARYVARITINAAATSVPYNTSGILILNKGHTTASSYICRGIHIVTGNGGAGSVAIGVDSMMSGATEQYGMYAHGCADSGQSVVGMYSECSGLGDNFGLVVDHGYVVIDDIGGRSSFGPSTYLTLNTDHLTGKTGLYIATGALEVDGDVFFEDAIHFKVPQHDGSSADAGDLYWDTDDGELRFVSPESTPVTYVIPLYTPTP